MGYPLKWKYYQNLVEKLRIFQLWKSERKVNNLYFCFKILFVNPVSLEKSGLYQRHLLLFVFCYCFFAYNEISWKPLCHRKFRFCVIDFCENLCSEMKERFVSMSKYIFQFFGPHVLLKLLFWSVFLFKFLARTCWLRF